MGWLQNNELLLKDLEVGACICAVCENRSRSPRFVRGAGND